MHVANPVNSRRRELHFLPGVVSRFLSLSLWLSAHGIMNIVKDSNPRRKTYGGWGIDLKEISRTRPNRVQIGF